MIAGFIAAVALGTAVGQSQSTGEQKVRFERSFSAMEGWVKPPEKPYRDGVCLNGLWKFQPVATPPHAEGSPPALPDPLTGPWSTTPIKVPSPWNVNHWTMQGHHDDPAHPYETDSVYYPSYPRTWDDIDMGWLRRTFQVPTSWSGKRLRIRFDAVAGDCDVYVNGKHVGHNFDSFLPFEVDVTDVVHRGEENELTVGVRASKLFDHPGKPYGAFRAPYPPGSMLDHIAGIWQDVTLLEVPDVRVSDAFVRPRVGAGRLDVDVTVQNDTDSPKTVAVGGDVSPWINLAGKSVLDAPESKWTLGDRVISLPEKSVVVPAHGQTTTTLSASGKELNLWTPSTPHLYGLVVGVKEGGKTVDHKYVRFGWREFKISGRNLLLNGKKINLFGDILHPFGPFIGSRRYAWAWFKMIKDMGGNAVRLHAQPRPSGYLDLADEMGICVLDETALFGSSIKMDMDSAEAWKRFDDHYDRLVVRDRNHPSVFGWSCGNELFALFFNVPEDKQKLYYDRLKTYAQRSYKLDPTRQWVSCDGDEDLRGGVTVWSRHWGTGIPELADLDKPRMVGESGGSYYASPAGMAEINGDRAYESYRARNEALGIDLYANVKAAKKSGLAYFSASETAWFGLEHLPFGYSDHSRPPTLADGVWFGPYKEGEPGVQPERIPPYCMTFNPGFDPSLPVYRPLPMFEAFKAALAGAPLAWKKVDPPAVPKVPVKSAAVSFVGDPRGLLGRRLASYGLDISAAASDCLVVDGDSDLKKVAGLKERVDSVLRKGGTVLVALSPGSKVSGVNAVLPEPVSLTNRTSTLLVPGHDSVSAGLSNADLYFAEDSGDRLIAKCGLDGAFVSHGKTVLKASETEWPLFNEFPEEAKCSNILIYESLKKPSGVVLAEQSVGSGKLLVGCLDYDTASAHRTRVWRRLFANFGVKLGPPRSDWVLPIATADGPWGQWRYTTTKPSDEWMQPDFADGNWKSGECGFGTDTPHSQVRTRWDTPDIWLRRTVKLTKEDMDDLCLTVYHDEDAEIYINGVLVSSTKGYVQDYQESRFSAEAMKAIHEGDNVIAVHCHQTSGGQYIDVGISRGPQMAPKREYDPLRDGPKVPPPH